MSHWLLWCFGRPSLLGVFVLCSLRVLGAWSSSAWGVPHSGWCLPQLLGASEHRRRGRCLIGAPEIEL